MTLSHIVAVSENNVIGVNNDLPWDIPEDMEFFKSKTKGKIMIMGRKTFESVGHPLPNRLNIIITRNPSYTSSAKDVFVVPNIDKALAYAMTRVNDYDSEVFIIGGGEIYRDTMKIVDTIYLTRIHKMFDGDVHYPDVDPKKFKLVESRERFEPVPFTFQTFKRIDQR